jgi:acetyltransferase-like isoleucine patch superfamily enzyme
MELQDMSLPERMPCETRIALHPHENNGVALSVGEYSYGTPALFYDVGDPECRLTIGKFCCFADNVKVHLGRFGRHHYDFLSSYPVGMIFGSPSSIDMSAAWNRPLGVTIGSDVWIARDSTIMAGVTIGDGAVIGASTLITKDVEPYTIVGGVPGRVLKKRFSSAQIERLLKLQWWNWPTEVLKKHVDLFYRSDIEAVIEELERQCP